MSNESGILDLLYDKIDRFDMVVEIHIGSYQESGKAFLQLAEYLQQKAIKTMTMPIAILLDDPTYIESCELRSKIGYIVNENIKTDDRIMLDAIAGCTCLVCEYKGEMQNVANVYQYLQNRIETDGYMLVGYPRELYIKHPAIAGEDKLCHIQIQIPVAQM